MGHRALLNKKKQSLPQIVCFANQKALETQRSEASTKASWVTCCVTCYKGHAWQSKARTAKKRVRGTTHRDVVFVEKATPIGRKRVEKVIRNPGCFGLEEEGKEEGGHGFVSKNFYKINLLFHHPLIRAKTVLL